MNILKLAYLQKNFVNTLHSSYTMTQCNVKIAWKRQGEGKNTKTIFKLTNMKICLDY